jgi:tetratricopeptide (TPR) repeat protein
VSFFKKLFGSKKQPAPKTLKLSAARASVNLDETITAHDKYGREIQITKRDWLDSVLLGNLKKAWGNPDELYGLIVSGFQDGFFAEIEDAVQQLAKIDPTPERGVTTLGILFLQTDRPAEAQRVLTQHIAKHGECAVTLTNLAKAQSALGDEALSLQTLWHALELDPNQDNALLWYESIHRDQDGEAAGLVAFERVAALPGSWRAQLWIARARLAQGDLDAALALYHQSLSRAGSPIPTDLLMQMSGDLGNQGHLPQIIELVAPHYELTQHGIQVGNNLLKTYLDTGHLDAARALLQQLQAQQRPDWAQTLNYWEDALAKADTATATPIKEEELKVGLLTLNGPLWLRDKHPFPDLFPVKDPDAPRISFVGNTVEKVKKVDVVTMQRSDSPGRMSRALPLFLSEHVALHSNAQTSTFIFWVQNGNGGFMLSGVKSSDEAIAQYSRQGADAVPDKKAADFSVYTHLITQGENWTLQLRLIRTIDAKCLVEFSYNFPEAGFHKIANQVLADLDQALQAETDIQFQTVIMPLGANFTLQTSQLDHYLLRLEQCLAVRCDTLNKTGTSLSNPTEIIDGTIQLCLQNPSHLPSRLLLTRILNGIHKKDPKLAAAFSEKVNNLQSEFPIASADSQVLSQEFEEALSD